MGVTDWTGRTISNIRRHGIRTSLEDAVYEFRLGIVRRLAGRTYDPEYIWDRDWDVLVILDACRLDLLEDVADDYPFIDHIDSHTSAATSTTVWSRRNFSAEFADEMAQTTYITANPNSITIGDIRFPEECSCGEPVRHDGRELTVACLSCGTQISGTREHPFDQFVELWRSQWDETLGTLPPETVTARSIEAMREDSPQKLIVHYNQPHHPFVIDDADGPRPVFDLDRETNVWQELRRGTVSDQEVWDGYRHTLRYVLDSVSDLLANVDAETVAITSDHGNALGEWGVYGHPNPPVPIDPLVEVPWIVTSARNTECRRPEDITAGANRIDEDVEGRLRDLGYM